MLGGLTRRTFLCIFGALGPVGPVLLDGAQRARPPVTLDGFVTLSERLTGHRPLDRATARIYLDALLEAPADRVLLTTLAHGTRTGAELSPAHAALEARIVESWYTGVHAVNGTAQVAGYEGALMWKALGRPAPGSCAGPAGDWSTAPRASA